MQTKPRVLLSIDFEDWHQLVHRRLGRADWDRPSSAFPRHVHAVLDLLDDLGARATFFLLGMTVATYPELAREVVARGHEAASHGHAHERVHTQTRDEFRADLERGIEVVERATSRRPTAYRAPAFSINRRTPWAYDVLAESGFTVDSSQYDSPRVPDRLGDIPSEPYRLGRLWELPVTGGGSYWRVLPPRGLRELAVLYFHPYEFGPALRADLPPETRPRRRLTAAKLVLWRNAGRGLVEKRLRRIAQTHRLVSYDHVYGDLDRLYGTRTRTLSPQGVLV